MALPSSVKDREYKAFVECNGQPAKRTKICQEAGETIKVEVEEESGLYLNTYNEANSVAGLATATVIDYTVPVTKEVKLKTIECSGDNRAIFKVEINTVTQAKKRTYFTEYNCSFESFNLILNAGDNIKVIVENKSNSIADFNANFLGVIQDA
jgi:hypothetical protein